MEKIKTKINKLFKIINGNKKIFIIVLALIIMLIIGLILILTRDTYAVAENDDYINIVCPEKASPGEVVECVISLNTATINGLGIQADINSTEGLEFVEFVEDTSCTGNYCWSKMGVSEETLMFLSKGYLSNPQTYVTGLHTLGTIKYKIPDDAESNEEYKVSLNNIILGGKKESIDAENDEQEESLKEINLEKVETIIKISSSINTLKSIKYGDKTIDIEEGKTEYEISSNDESINISAVPTDENAIVSGDIGNINLHYGTNILNIIVNSESNTEKNYVLKVNKQYKLEFSDSNYYKTDADNNYLYTGTDNKKETILSNINLPSELNSDIENNKYIIKYNEEILLEMSLLNVNFNDYNMTGSKIYIDKNIAYDEFINNILFNGVTIKIFNKDNEEINSGILTEDDTLKVYYNDEELDSYSVVTEKLDMGDLNIDETNKIINRVKVNTSYGELKENISTTGNVTIKNKDGQTLNDSDKVKTGDTVEIKLLSGTVKYKISVLGDINGNGSIEVGDVSLLYRYLKLQNKVNEMEYVPNDNDLQLKPYQISACAIVNDGAIKINDVARLYRYIKEKITVLEVE